jgi:hypothetical protein
MGIVNYGNNFMPRSVKRLMGSAEVLKNVLVIFFVI